MADTNVSGPIPEDLKPVVNVGLHLSHCPGIPDGFVTMLPCVTTPRSNTACFSRWL